MPVLENSTYTVCKEKRKVQSLSVVFDTVTSILLATTRFFIHLVSLYSMLAPVFRQYHFIAQFGTSALFLSRSAAHFFTLLRCPCQFFLPSFCHGGREGGRPKISCAKTSSLANRPRRSEIGWIPRDAVPRPHRQSMSWGRSYKIGPFELLLSIINQNPSMALDVKCHDKDLIFWYNHLRFSRLIDLVQGHFECYLYVWIFHPSAITREECAGSPSLLHSPISFRHPYHLVLPLDPLEASLEEAVVVGHGLGDVGRAGLVEGGVDGERDGPLGPDEERVVAQAVSEEGAEVRVARNKGSRDFRTLDFQIIQITKGSILVNPVLDKDLFRSLALMKKLLHPSLLPLLLKFVCQGQTESSGSFNFSRVIASIRYLGICTCSAFSVLKKETAKLRKSCNKRSKFSRSGTFAFSGYPLLALLSSPRIPSSFGRGPVMKFSHQTLGWLHWPKGEWHRAEECSFRFPQLTRVTTYLTLPRAMKGKKSKCW